VAAPLPALVAVALLAPALAALINKPFASSKTMSLHLHEGLMYSRNSFISPFQDEEVLAWELA
jgi:hypothetical protein